MNHQNPTYLKRRSGIYYFTRRIPSILQQQYKRDRVYVPLKPAIDVKLWLRLRGFLAS